MYYRTETYTTTGNKTSWNLDASIAPFNAAVNITLLSGTVSYKLQYSLDPLADPKADDNSAVWLDSVDIPAGTTGSASAAFITPVARVRLVIAAITGPLKMEVLQGASIN